MFLANVAIAYRPGLDRAIRASRGVPLGAPRMVAVTRPSCCALFGNAISYSIDCCCAPAVAASERKATAIVRRIKPDSSSDLLDLLVAFFLIGSVDNNRLGAGIAHEVGDPAGFVEALEEYLGGDGKRYCHQCAERTEHPSPEKEGYHDDDRREIETLADEARLDEVVDDEIHEHISGNHDE